MDDSAFLRTELWHPLTVHFPIALLLLATLVKALAVFLRREPAAFWQKVGIFLLWVGVLSAWLAIYSGDLANGIVSRKICDPLVLKRHETAAFAVGWIFTGALAVELLALVPQLRNLGKIIRIGTLLLLLVGSGYLVYTAHLGAEVVYEQGGGVNKPSADCLGF